MSQTRPSTVISPFHGEHDHLQCQTEALSAAQKRCHQEGLRLTPLRQEVLEIVWASHNPIGAYDVLQKLQERGHKPAPPTAYRALDFLVLAQLIHRVESLNAYIGCPQPGVAHHSQFFICNECGHTAELYSAAVTDALEAGAKELGFSPNQPVIEIHGVCNQCKS